MTSLRKIGISLYPVKAIKMCSKSSHDLSIVGNVNSDLLLHLESVNFSPILDEWPIEKVSVESCEYEWFSFSDMFEKLDEQCLLIRLIEHSEHSYIKLRFWTVLKVLNVSPNDLSIGYQETFAINNVRNHHYLIEF